MSREHITFLTGRRRESVAPQRNLVNDRGKLGRAERSVSTPVAKMMKSNVKVPASGLDCRDVSFVTNRFAMRNRHATRNFRTLRQRQNVS